MLDPQIKKIGITMRFYLLGLVIGLCNVAVQAETLSDQARQTSERHEDCKNTIIFHGMLSRVQFECGFNSYSDKLIYATRQCFREMDKKESDAFLREGMDLYDERVSNFGKENTCSSALKTFPKYLRK